MVQLPEGPTVAISHQHVRIGLDSELFCQLFLASLDGVEEADRLLEIVVWQSRQLGHEFGIILVLEEEDHACALAFFANGLIISCFELSEIVVVALLVVVLENPFNKSEFLLNTGKVDCAFQFLNSSREELDHWKLLELEDLFQFAMLRQIKFSNLNFSFEIT